MKIVYLNQQEIDNIDGGGCYCTCLGHPWERYRYKVGCVKYSFVCDNICYDSAWPKWRCEPIFGC